MHKYKVQILDIIPSTLDEGNEEHVIDTYVKIKMDNLKVWCFVPDWRTYFPYWPPYHPYGTGKTLVKNLIGKTIGLNFKFLNLKTELSDERIKTIVPVVPNMVACDHYTIVGEIINKEPLPKLPDTYERFQVDCGFILNGLSAGKGAYNMGDFIRSEGRLDVYLVEEEKLAKARRDGVVRSDEVP